MEENKVAIRKRAEKLAKRLEREIGTGKAIGIIFRELVTVRNLAQAELMGLAEYGRAHLDNLKPPFVKEPK